jgi:uncharacterized protein
MIPTLLLFAGTMLLSLWAMWRVKSVYNKYSQQPCASGATGAQVAQAILDQAGIRDVEIVPHNEMLGDHYDPIHKRLVLSEANYHGQSPAALGVAAHECGHAIQHKIAYAPLEWRMMAVGATNFASKIVMFLPIIGIFTGMAYGKIALLMAIAWGVIMVFNLITLPVEFDASRRATTILGNMGYIGSAEEMLGVKRVLNAAGWTYVAAFITSLAYFLWHLLPLLMGGRRNEDLSTPTYMKIIEELLTSGAPDVTTQTVDQIVRQLPKLRAKFAQSEDEGLDLLMPLDFLSQVLEDFSSGLCRELSYHAVADIAFALQYLEQETDLIPDSLPDVGYADDAAVMNRVLEKHSDILKEYAALRGFRWEDLQTI